MTKTLGCDSKSETSRPLGKNPRLRDRNKCNINETSRPFANAAEISRSNENSVRPMVLQVPFATPHVVKRGENSHELQRERLPKSKMASSDGRSTFEIVHVLRFGNALNEELCYRFIFTNLQQSLDL